MFDSHSSSPKKKMAKLSFVLDTYSELGLRHTMTLSSPEPLHLYGGHLCFALINLNKRKLPMVQNVWNATITELQSVRHRLDARRERMRRRGFVQRLPPTIDRNKLDINVVDADVDKRKVQLAKAIERLVIGHTFY